MLRIVLLNTLILVSLSSLSASILRKSLSRRQSDQANCYVIEGFDCICLYRLTCTTNRDLPSPITVLSNEKHKYQSISLVILAHHNVKITDRTFEPLKELFTPNGDTFEFRVKFENFTALHLSSPGILNRVFPDNAPSQARKNMALEIYNSAVVPTDDLHLFQNLNADIFEIFAYHPFRGSFQQLFDGANIQFLRISGVHINSDLSQPFTGNIGRLELAKQASELSAQNFPVYPAHEMIINAFYTSDFNTDNPPNYSNLVELRVSTNDHIPANAFQQFPNLRVLSVSTEKDIDPNAFNGLNHLEKLTVKQPHPSMALINSVPTVTELETNIKNYDEHEQCQLVEKLANGQVAVSNWPNDGDCNCIASYLNAATGRMTCNAKDCDRSTCAAIRNNYDPSLNTFKTPPSIRRADGTDALYPREQQVYTTAYQIPDVDREKLQKASMAQHTDDHAHKPHVPDHSSGQSEHSHHQPDSQEGQDQGPSNYDGAGRTDQDANNQQGETDEMNQSKTEGSENSKGTDGGENQDEGQDNKIESDGTSTDLPEDSAENSQTASKKTGIRWLPIIIIIAAIAALILFGLLFYFFRKKGTNKGYAKAAANEQAAAATTTAQA